MNQRSMPGFKRHTLLAAAFAAAVCGASWSSAAQADPLVSFSSGSYGRTGLGDQIGSTLDQFYIFSSGASNLSVASPVTVPVASYAFLVGINCTDCSLTPHYVADVPVTVTGYGTETLALPYSWSSTGPTDFLHFGTIDPLVFSNGKGSVLDFVFQPLSTISSSGAPIFGQINATISAVPEPGTYAMILSGLGLLALAVRRRSTIL